MQGCVCVCARARAWSSDKCKEPAVKIHLGSSRVHVKSCRPLIISYPLIRRLLMPGLGAPGFLSLIYHMRALCLFVLCVCMRERERERESVCVCVCVSVCV